MGFLDKLLKGNTNNVDSLKDGHEVKDAQEIKDAQEKKDAQKIKDSSYNANEFTSDSKVSALEVSGSDNNQITIKILGSGCKNCITLTDNVKTALAEMNLVAKVVKVTDLGEITGYGIMSTPALVVNEKVISYGKVLKPKEVIKLLEKVTR